MGSQAVAAISKNKKSEAPLSASAESEVLPLQGACGASAGLPRFLGGSCGCERCRGLQAKLVTGVVGDPFEQEADRIAEAVSSPGRFAPSRSVSPPTSHGSRPAISTADGGSPLDSQLRSRIEPVVGTSLDHVRVHDGVADRALAKRLHAKAFTHGSHIWLGPAQSSSDTKLLAHEAAHVVQQGAAAASSPARIQRLADDSQPGMPKEDIPAGGWVLQNILGELPAAADQRTGNGATSDQQAGPQDKPDPAAQARKRAELEARGKPAVDHANLRKPHLERAADAASKEARKPPRPDKLSAGAGKSGVKSKDKTAHKATRAGARRGVPGSLAPPRPPPAAPARVQLPQIALPRDSAGKPLAPDPGGDAQMLRLAALAQAMRTQGFVMRQRAAQEHHNAAVIQRNIAKAQDGITQAESGLAESEDHLSYRREVAGQTQDALHISEQKADMVASGAPKFQAQSAEGKAKSGPMSGEAKDLAGQNAAKTPDDPDAAQKSQEQGQKIGKVGSDIGSMDDAMSQTQARADDLAGQAAQAKQDNAQTQQNIAGTQASLDQTGARLGQLSDQNSTARTRLAAHAAGPGQLASGAASLDQQGEAAIQASIAMERRIHAAQEKYLAGMQSVPQSMRRAASGSAGNSLLVQRQAESGSAPADARVDLNLGGKVSEALPDWLTGEEKQTEQQRAQAQAAEKQRREQEIKDINAKAGGDFGRLTAADKAGIALSLTARHIFGSIGGIQWPNFLGKMLQGLVDPRMALMGIVSGLSMTLSGAANLFSAEQWKKDPLGNLLKSAADIATGITIILGSITALAMAIIAILVAAAILTLGALGPLAAAVIPFCWTVVGTVGPWTITAAGIALELNGLLLIKDLIDAATADTAEKLQSESDKVTQDAKTAGNMAMQIGLAAVGEAGGEALMSTEFGQGMASGMREVGEEFGIVKPTAEVALPATEAVPPESAGPPPEAAPAKTDAAAPAAESAKAPTPGKTLPSAPEATQVPAAGEGTTSAPEAGKAPAPAESARPGSAPEEQLPSETAAPSEASKPALDEQIVAEQPAVDGHTVKVNEAGECLVCTDCVKLREKVEADLAASDVPPEERAQIERDLEAVEQTTDPAAKAEAGADVQAEVKQASAEPATQPSGSEAPAPEEPAPKPGEAEPAEEPAEPAQAKSPKDKAADQVRERLDDTREQLRAKEADIQKLEAELHAAESKVRALQKEALATKGEAHAQALEKLNAAKAELDELRAQDELGGVRAERAKLRDLEGRLENALKEGTYSRPTDFRAGVRDTVWKNAPKKGPNGGAVDPSLKEIMPEDDWVMGHKYGYEFRKMQVRAMEEGWTRERFLDECNKPEYYRPELPETNASHKYEAADDIYFGP
jgi:hypothetical protein